LCLGDERAFKLKMQFLIEKLHLTDHFLSSAFAMSNPWIFSDWLQLLVTNISDQFFPTIMVIRLVIPFGGI
jgi:hypothetical protein